MGKDSASKIKKQDNTTHIIIVLFMILVNRDNRQGNVGGLSSLSYNLIKAYWTAVLRCSWDQLRVVDCLVWHSMLLYNWLISNCNAKQYWHCYQSGVRIRCQWYKGSILSVGVTDTYHLWLCCVWQWRVLYRSSWSCACVRKDWQIPFLRRFSTSNYQGKARIFFVFWSCARVRWGYLYCGYPCYEVKNISCNVLYL